MPILGNDPVDVPSGGTYHRWLSPLSDQNDPDRLGSDAWNKWHVDSEGAPIAPVTAGFVGMWAGTVAAIPVGWLLCNGASVLRADYPTLFAAIGTIHGSVDGTHFTLPDLRDRFIAGVKQDQSGTPKTNATGALLQSGGANSHSHSGHAAHNVTQPSAHAAHNVTQPSAHSTHNVTQPSAHSALGTHAHELPFHKLTGGTGVFRMLASSVFGTGTSRTPESQAAAPAASSTGAVVLLSQAVTGGTPSAHSGTAVDAHSAHAGAAVDAHSAHAGSAVDAHSSHDTPIAVPPFYALAYVIATGVATS